MNNDDTQGDLYDITDEVENRYEKLRKVPEVNAYLEAELTMCKTMQKIHNELMERIPISVPDEVW